MPPRLRKNENKPHIPAIPFEKCAAKTTTDGKPGTTVLDHGIHVGRVAEALAALKPECVKRLLPQYCRP